MEEADSSSIGKLKSHFYFKKIYVYVFNCYDVN